MTDKTALGDRMKCYEAVTRTVLPRRTYALIRVDVRAAHSYLRGAAGYLLVADGTRRATLDTVDDLQRLTESHVGRVPFVVAVNKADLRDQWQIDDAAIEERPANRAEEP